MPVVNLAFPGCSEEDGFIYKARMDVSLVSNAVDIFSLFLCQWLAFMEATSMGMGTENQPLLGRDRYRGW